jgi:hypothetical protein
MFFHTPFYFVSVFLRRECIPAETLCLRALPRRHSTYVFTYCQVWSADIEPLRIGVARTQTSNQAMQLTASKPAVYACECLPSRVSLRGRARGLAAADLVSR